MGSGGSPPSWFRCHACYSGRVGGEAPALLEVLDFDESDSDGVARAGEDDGVSAGRQVSKDGGLAGIRWSETIRAQLHRLAKIVHPIIVKDKPRSVGVVQVDRGVVEDADNPNLRERRAETMERRARKSELFPGS